LIYCLGVGVSNMMPVATCRVLLKQISAVGPSYLILKSTSVPLRSVMRARSILELSTVLDCRIGRCSKTMVAGCPVSGAW